LYILFFKVLHSRRDEKRFWTNGSKHSPSCLCAVF
jgi:hypothetical protein